MLLRAVSISLLLIICTGGSLGHSNYARSSLPPSITLPENKPICPSGTAKPVACPRELCAEASCPTHPTALCRVTAICGECTFRWFLCHIVIRRRKNRRCREVTDECAECTGEGSGSGSGDGSGGVVLCNRTLSCMGQRCAGFPRAKCRVNTCGDCSPKWFIGKTDLTPFCGTKTSAEPPTIGASPGGPIMVTNPGVPIMVTDPEDGGGIQVPPN